MSSFGFWEKGIFSIFPTDHWHWQLDCDELDDWPKTRGEAWNMKNDEIEIVIVLLPLTFPFSLFLFLVPRSHSSPVQEWNCSTIGNRQLRIESDDSSDTKWPIEMAIIILPYCSLPTALHPSLHYEQWPVYTFPSSFLSFILSSFLFPFPSDNSSVNSTFPCSLKQINHGK